MKRFSKNIEHLSLSDEELREFYGTYENCRKELGGSTRYYRVKNRLTCMRIFRINKK